MHPTEDQLALFASGDAGFVRGLLLARHVRNCASCNGTVEEYRGLTAALAADVFPVDAWNQLAAEMHANIRLGLEAGACVRGEEAAASWWNPRLGVAMATLVILAGAGFVLRPSAQPSAQPVTVAAQHHVAVDTEGVTITNVILE
jgi:hypothetical protein